MSPLTTSYFTCWALFDACVEPANETIGATVLEVGAAFGMHIELLHLIRLMQESRMGLYAHEGTEGRVVVLRELATDAVHRAEARAVRVAGVLPPHLARGPPAGAPRPLRAPHEVRADAHVLERFRVRGLREPPDGGFRR